MPGPSNDVPWGPGGIPCRVIDMIDLQIKVKVDVRDVVRLLLALSLYLTL